MYSVNQRAVHTRIKEDPLISFHSTCMCLQKQSHTHTNQKNKQTAFISLHLDRMMLTDTVEKKSSICAAAAAAALFSGKWKEWKK